LNEIEITARRNRETKRKERVGDIREESSTTSSLPINIFQEENNWQKNKYHFLGEHLLIMPCSRGQNIFLVLQYLLPPRPRR